jgi:hypothetical protein
VVVTIASMYGGLSVPPKNAQELPVIGEPPVHVGLEDQVTDEPQLTPVGAPHVHESVHPRVSVPDVSRTCRFG